MPPSVIARQSYVERTALTLHSTAAFDSTGGDLIVVFGASQSNVTMTLTDNKGNTWIPAAGPTNHSPGVDLRSQLWYARAPNVGTGHTLTMNLSLAEPLELPEPLPPCGGLPPAPPLAAMETPEKATSSATMAHSPMT